MIVQAVEAAAPSTQLDANPMSPHHGPEMAAALLAAHMPGIDVLRGIAILMVVAFHGLAYRAPNVNWGSRAANAIYGLTAWGWLGVNLFFVLSGFLITGILDDTIALKNFYSRFYIRRALRILPAYLAVLAMAWALRFITADYVVVCMLFLANMPGLLLRHGYLFYGPFWSLAVEEQFYLFWPILFRKLGRRGMLGVSLALIAVCPALRALAFAHMIHTGDALSKTWMIADNLAVGAVLAILLRWQGVRMKTVVALGSGMLMAGAAGVAVLLWAGRMGAGDVLRNSVGMTCFLLIAGSAVVAMLYVFRARPLPGWLQAFVFFGEISYGLYLVHLLLLQLWDRSFGMGFQTNLRMLMVRFVVANGAAVGVAVLSKRWFEDPILRLKRRISTAR